MNNIFDNKKVLNVPNLRFPEFTDEWQIFKCSDVLDFYPTNSLSWDQLNFCNGAIRNIHYGLIHKGLATYVYIDKALLPYINSDIEMKKYFECKNGDIIFADASEDTLDVGKAVEIIDCDKTQLVCGLHTLHGRDTKSYTAVGYKGYVFASTSFRHQVRRIAQGTKVFSISSRNFKELFIGVPSKPEQTKIAKLLSLIDQRLETQNKIIKDLKSFKKGVASIIYRKIESACCKKNCINDIITYEQPTKYLVNSENYVSFAKEETPVLTANKSFLLGYTNENTGIYSKGDCIIFDDFTMDFKYVAFPFKIKSSAIKILTAPTSITLKFIYEYFNYLELQATDHKRHYISEVSRIKIVLPDYAAQKRTVAILTAIELKMENEINILQKYKTKKAFLLNNMFI